MLFSITDHEELKSNIFGIEVNFQLKPISLPGISAEIALEMFCIGVAGTNHILDGVRCRYGSSTPTSIGSREFIFSKC